MSGRAVQFLRLLGVFVGAALLAWAVAGSIEVWRLALVSAGFTLILAPLIIKEEP